MSIIVHFKPKGMTKNQYNETIKRLEAAGAGKFAGRTYHFCYGTDESRFVTDVFDSLESFQAFGQILMPILQELGIDVGQPDINEVLNSIEA